VRRLLIIAIAALSFTATPAAVYAQSDTGTDETIVTLADGKNLDQCISSVPQPGCRTSNEADGKQLALLGILVAGMAFLGWKISSGVRARNREPISKP
jgi:hypothetical protein